MQNLEVRKTESCEPVVFSFLDYRQFLNAYYEFRKSKQPSYSFQMFARQADLGRAILYAVVTGRRKLNAQKARALALACKLNAAEEEYFLALVLWNECTDEKTKKIYWQRLCALAPKAGFYVLKTQEQEIIGTWYVLALLELVNTKDFQWDLDWIAKRFGNKISKESIHKTVQELLLFGFLKIENGKLVPQNKTITVGRDEVSRERIRRYHQKNIPMALYAMNEVDAELFEISTMSVGVSLSHLEEFRTRIRSFRKELLEYAATLPQTDEVYQLNLQFFPVTRKVK